jgi:hypothetical protein
MEPVTYMEYFPGEHIEQLEAPVCELYVPLKHAIHAVLKLVIPIPEL